MRLGIVLFCTAGLLALGTAWLLAGVEPPRGCTVSGCTDLSGLQGPAELVSPGKELYASKEVRMGRGLSTAFPIPTQTRIQEKL